MQNSFILYILIIRSYWPRMHLPRYTHKHLLANDTNEHHHAHHDDRYKCRHAYQVCDRPHEHRHERKCCYVECGNDRIKHGYIQTVSESYLPHTHYHHDLRLVGHDSTDNSDYGVYDYQR